VCLLPDNRGCDYAALYSILEEATAAQPPELRLKYVSSATEQEIWCGALGVSEEARASVFCFIRSIEPLESGEGDDLYIDRLDGKVDVDAQARLSELKARLKRALPKQNFWDYRALRRGAGITTDHLLGPLIEDLHQDRCPNLCQDVYDALAGVIREEIARDREVDPMETELASHATFAQQLAAPQFFTGRAEILAQLAGYLATTQKQMIGVIGASGSGKSSLMAYAAEQARRAHPNARVIVRFIGATPDSANIRLLLQSLCRQMSRGAGGETHQPTADYGELVSEFWRRLEPPAGSAPLILFLDALDQLSEVENALGLAWLPPALPQNVHLVVSASPDLASALARRVGPEALWKLNPMEAEEGRALLERWLNGARRTLQPLQRQTLLDGFQESRLPLYLRIAFEQACQWRSWEKAPPLAGNIPGLIEHLFSRLADPAAHGELLISRSLGYLVAAKTGLAEDELLDLLSEDSDVLGDFERCAHHTPPERRLPVVIWSRLYFDLRAYLRQQSADGVTLLVFFHRQFKEAAAAKYLGDQVRRTRHAHMARYFDEQTRQLSPDGDRRFPLRALSELPCHQAHAGMRAELRTTLLDFGFLQAKISAVGPQPVIEDIDLALRPDLCPSGEDTDGLRTVQDAIRMSAHVLMSDPTQFAGQILSRLPGTENEDLRNFARAVAASKKFFWLRSVTPNLIPAGNPLLRTLSGHTETLNCIEVLPDGRRAISGGSEGTLRVWDLETGTALHTLRQSKGGVKEILVTSDGSRAICAFHNAWQLRMWNLDDRTELPAPVGASDPVMLTPDGRCAVSEFVNLDELKRRGGTSSAENLCKVWDPMTGAVRFNLPKAKFPLVFLPSSVRAISVSSGTGLKVWDLSTGEEQAPFDSGSLVQQFYLTPDERLLISCGYFDKTVTIWYLAARAPVHRLGVSHMAVKYGCAMAFSSNGRCSVFCGEDNALHVWDLNAIEERYRLTGHSDLLAKITISYDGRRAVSLSADSCRLWDLEKGIQLRALTESNSALLAVVTVPGKERAIVTSGRERNLKVWDMESGAEVQTHPFYHHGQTLAANASAVATTREGRFAVFGLADHTMRVCDLERNDHDLSVLEGHPAPVTHVVALADGRRVVSCSNDGSIKLWDVSRHRKPFVHKGHPEIVTAIAFTAHSARVVSISQYSTRTFKADLKVWDPDTGKELQTLTGHSWSVDAIAVQPDGRRVILSAGGPWIRTVGEQYPEENDVILWDLDAGVEFRRLVGHIGIVGRVATTPNGWRAVSASEDETAHVWDLQRGITINTLSLPHDIVSRSARPVWITPDGSKIIAAAPVGVTVWGVADGAKLCSIYHDASVSVTVGADSRHFFTCNEHQELRVWSLESGRCIHTLRAREWTRYVRTILSVGVEPDGKWLVAPSPDSAEGHVLKIWDLERESDPEVLGKHTGTITAVALSGDGQRAASVSDDHTLAIWDVKGRMRLAMFTAENPLTCCALAPDGRVVAAGDSYGHVHMLRLEGPENTPPRRSKASKVKVQLRRGCMLARARSVHDCGRSSTPLPIPSSARKPTTTQQLPAAHQPAPVPGTRTSESAYLQNVEALTPLFGRQIPRPKLLHPYPPARLNAILAS